MTLRESLSLYYWCYKLMERNDIMELKEIGLKCKKLRESLGYYQSQVAIELGVSKETISSFECGRNNNAVILLWYLNHGLKPFDD